MVKLALDQFTALVASPRDTGTPVCLILLREDILRLLNFGIVEHPKFSEAGLLLEPDRRPTFDLTPDAIGLQKALERIYQSPVL